MARVSFDFTGQLMPQQVFEKLRPWLSREANSNGEWEAYCPLHDDKQPSASINFEKDTWFCHGCGDTDSSLTNLVERIPAVRAENKRQKLAKASEPERLPDNAAIAGWHGRLKSDKSALKWLHNKRGLDTPILQKYQIGWDGYRYTIPVRNAAGELVNLRRYNPKAKNSKYKMMGLTGRPTTLYPGVPEGSRVVLCEGEWDCLLLLQEGISAITTTGGATNWKEDWSKEFAGRTVDVVYDCDVPGRKGAKKAAKSLGAGAQVHNLDLDEDGEDITDWFVKYKRDANELHALLDKNRKGAASAKEKLWPVLDEKALYGLAGDVVNTILPHSEAAAASLLTQFLVCFGNAVGMGPHFVIEGDRHTAREFMSLVGSTASARKGLSWGRIRSIFSSADRDWTDEHIYSGLSTGEGLAASFVTVDKKSGEVLHEADDKRMMVIEEEFARVLAAIGRDTNTLSTFVRSGWDRDEMRIMTRGNPLYVKGVHLSIIAHITPEELQSKLKGVDIANGFLNRFLVVLVKKSKDLPEGGNLDPFDLVSLQGATALALDKARKIGEVTRDPKAAAAWRRMYPGLVDEDATGVYAAATARARAHVMRLSMIYALIDGSAVIRLEHQAAAYALWRYCARSAAVLFEGATGDPIADKLLRALEESSNGRLSHTDQSVLVFHRNQSARRLGEARALLLQLGKTEEYSVGATGGADRKMTRLSR